MEKPDDREEYNEFEDMSPNKREIKYQRNHFAQDICDEDMQDLESDNLSNSKSKALVGRWTNREHELFVECLKKYGKDWDKIEEKIPTRTGTQIRSHAQKFFARIRKEFKTHDPMTYINKNMCDTSRVYKFESFKDKTLEDSMKNVQELEEEEKLPPSSQNNHKVAKMNKQNLDKFDHMQKMKRLHSQIIEGENEDKHNKMFKITKMNNKKESSQGSFYNISSEEQKLLETNYPFLNKNFKSSKEGSDGDSNTSTNISYICLNEGKVIIKGNEIETVVP